MDGSPKVGAMCSSPQDYDYNQMWREVYGDIQRFGPGHFHNSRIVRSWLADLDYTTILDVGCGRGHNRDVLMGEDRTRSFDGVDISSEAVDHARNRFPGNFRVCDIERDCPEGKWDLVSCSLVLEHLKNDDAALRNLYQCTGRYLLVVTIAGNFERYRKWEETQGHLRNYQAGELEAKLERTGFRLRRVMHWGFPFFSPIARTMQNRSCAGVGKFSWAAHVAALLFKALYFLNSGHKGDMLFILAEV